MTVLLPSVHLNGTSKNSLLKQYMDCHSSVYDAILTLRKNGPNPRDYYVQPSEHAYEYARIQHEDWIGKLEDIQSNLEELIEGIDEGGHKNG